MLYSDLVLSGKLYSYLADIDTQAQTRLHLLVTQLAEKEGKEHLYHLYGGGSVCLFASLDPYGTFRSTAGMVADSLAGIGI